METFLIVVSVITFILVHQLLKTVASMGNLREYGREFDYDTKFDYAQ